MEDELLTSQLFPPGSDVAIGFRPSQIVWGRTGNDLLLGYQPTNPNPTQVDILLGDLAIEDPAFREWNDTFVLGDWTRPYYTNGPAIDFGLGSLALIADFSTELDTIQLYGNAEDYQLLDLGFGTAVLFEDETELDPIGFLLGASDLNLSDSYFEYKGVTPPAVTAVPEIKQFGTTEYDIPLSIAVDPAGGFYVAGGTNGAFSGDNEGLRDNFVTKYDDQGNTLFSQQFGTDDFDTIYGIDTDGAGNYYVTGVTGGDLSGPKQADELDTFVAKYDTQGNQLWIQQIGQNVVFNAFSIAVDKETGDVVISGADVLETLEDDTFVIKFDTNGNQQWATETGLPGPLAFDESYGLTVSDDGSIYATGWTSGDLGGPNEGLYDNWLAKYDNATGETEWITQYGTSDYEWSWDVRTDSAENVYTAGWTLGDLGGSSAGSFDAYLNRFDQEGNLVWTEQFGSAGDDELYSLYIDDSDNVFVGGYTNGDLGGTNAGSFDAWIAKYDQSGNQIWINQFGTSDRDELYGIVADEKGNLYATGVTQGSLGDTNEGSFDGWLASLDAASGELLDFGAAPAPNEPADNESAPSELPPSEPALSELAFGETDDLINGRTPDNRVGSMDSDLLTGDLTGNNFDGVQKAAELALATNEQTGTITTGGFEGSVDLTGLASSLGYASLGLGGSTVATGDEKPVTVESVWESQLNNANGFAMV